MTPSIFTWERRDYGLMQEISRRDAIKKNILIVVFATAIAFIGMMAWKEWRLHEASLKSSVSASPLGQFCTRGTIPQTMSTTSLVANFRELCSH